MLGIYCGDGAVQPGYEACGDGVLDSQHEQCGDGVLDSQHEQCDEGDRVDGDGCESNCRLSTLLPG